LAFIQFYTERGVGSGIAIYIKNKLTHQIKHKQHNRCSNNQAEQTAILKALQALDTIKLSNDTPRTVKIFTDSKITLLSLKNVKNRKHVIEQIRREAHSAISGNELADKLAKEATENSEMCNNKIPRSEIERQESEKNHSKMATAMERHRQRTDNQGILFQHQDSTKNGTKTNT
jgi:ribonuclease HI